MVALEPARSCELIDSLRWRSRWDMGVFVGEICIRGGKLLPRLVMPCISACLGWPVDHSREEARNADYRGHLTTRGGRNEARSCPQGFRGHGSASCSAGVHDLRGCG